MSQGADGAAVFRLFPSPGGADGADGGEWPGSGASEARTLGGGWIGTVSALPFAGVAEARPPAIYGREN